MSAAHQRHRYHTDPESSTRFLLMALLFFEALLFGACALATTPAATPPCLYYARRHRAVGALTDAHLRDRLSDSARVV